MASWPRRCFARCTPHADSWPRSTRNGVLATSAFCKAHPSHRFVASECQEWRPGHISILQGAPLTQIRILGVLGMAPWPLLRFARRTPHTHSWPRSARDGAFWPLPHFARRTPHADSWPRNARDGAFWPVPHFARRTPHADSWPLRTLRALCTLRTLRTLRTVHCAIADCVSNMCLSRDSC